MSEKLTQEIRKEIEQRIIAYKERYINELDMEHAVFLEMYPKLASVFEFYRDIFSEIEKKVENARVAVEPYVSLVDVAYTKITLAYPDRQKITLIRHYAEELEEKGYVIYEGRRYAPENVFFHEFLHVLCNYRPDLFDYGCSRIDMFPELTIENPPKTSEEILKRIDEMNSRELKEIV